jgi:hypothetical protein
MPRTSSPRSDHRTDATPRPRNASSPDCERGSQTLWRPHHGSLESVGGAACGRTPLAHAPSRPAALIEASRVVQALPQGYFGASPGLT